MDILVQPLNRIIRAAPGVNLLDALRAAQVPMSYSCLSGRCGICRCRVLDGEVLDGGREQQRPLDGMDGAVLACQTYVTEPCTIEVPTPEEAVVHRARVAKAKVVALDPMAAGIRRLLLRPARPMEFSPGQYAQLAFTPAHARPYSMAGLPGDELLEFHVQLVPKGRVSDHIAGQLRVGDTVKVSGPLGAAYLRKQHTGPILCVAGATGLAPVLSVVRGAVASGMRNPIDLYFGLRSPRELYGLAWLDALRQAHPALRVHVVMASGADPATQRRGLVTQAIAQDHDSLRGWQAYLCGSPPMVETTMLVALGKGIEATHIHAEAFYMQGD
ncbi:2Fe-2S iron-sulfur cluster-binding protein [Pseudorhodoferax sp. Leaf274]|uniref:2Fe-2S iron-sulfur cluster-binding protein n=1 Tax=Pseudorhodoferax sp. Leaf274 TaxID=1736318 RepID=UPI00070356D2|nr:2Fe-2S iron-sulfur cluster-binding protein [Pseudorhodoferax sp. Leaf274]KQP49179.1 naphthalene 1,2-dioxygenase [Pseudorhodoferax sp. Leaf274]